MIPPTSNPTVDNTQLSPPEPTTGPSLEHSLYLRDVSTQSISGYSYLGCYSNQYSPLNGTHTHFERLEPDFCCNLCRNVNTKFEWCGVGAGRYCFCDSTTQTEPSSLPASSCNAHCYGAGSYACGGTGAIGLYSATVSFTPTVTTGVSEFKKLSSYSHYGCYVDPSTQRVLSEVQTLFQLNDPQFCCDYCASADGGYNWCGVENGHNCYCGKTTTSATQAVSTDCSIGCNGAADVQCGGRLRMNLYSATVSFPTGTTITTSPADSTSTAEATSGKSSGLSGGAIAGIVIGAVAGVALIVAAAFWFMRSRSRPGHIQPVEMEAPGRSPSEPRTMNKEPRELLGNGESPELPTSNQPPVELDANTGR
ncbi:hypothetical protein N7456_002022 [Penicillium angulare]|uniref:WSC domain-containing protein n=1 Tax=Penicillium angulare TaxID=116970 RepID=A0A9W9KPX7_9EURO|nr:hypothetical protein N7456_002022 [Penicillium angulare]